MEVKLTRAGVKATADYAMSSARGIIRLAALVLLAWILATLFVTWIPYLPALFRPPENAAMMIAALAFTIHVVK